MDGVRTWGATGLAGVEREAMTAKEGAVTPFDVADG